ncbi:DUF7269 family protein [Halovenus sp. HT40]|uniref:DUF7269 family protein n=1 Tax=Halovenus sp. HT40 TaxID=3126691 RepID=UPI00300F63DB
MNWHRPVFGGVGIAAILFGIGLLLAPGIGTVGPVTQTLQFVEAAGTTQVLLVTGGGLIAYLLVGLRSPDASESELGADRFAPEPEPEQLGLAGDQLDRQIQTAIDDGGESFATVRESLRQTAVSVYADAVGCAERQAWPAIEKGDWCSDSLVAAFLAGTDGPSPPFAAQVRLFVFPRRERRRRIERTVAVIERVQGQ